MYLEQSVDDAELVKRSLEGDTAAFEALVTHYQRVLFTVAVRMLGDREDARDATQNTFIKVYQKLNTYDPQYRFFSWVYRILRNECLNARRRQATEALTGERAHEADPRVALERHNAIGTCARRF